MLESTEGFIARKGLGIGVAVLESTEGFIARIEKARYRSGSDRVDRGFNCQD